MLAHIHDLFCPVVRLSAQFWTTFAVLLMALFINYVARRQGYFSLTFDNEYRSPVRLRYLIVSALIYIFTGFITSYLYSAFFIAHGNFITQEMLGWIRILVLITTFMVLALYLLLINNWVRRWIVWRRNEPLNIFTAGRQVGWGVISIIVAYPLVASFHLIMNLLTECFWRAPSQEQVAVRELMNTRNSPVMFFFTSLIIIFVVPIIEELLFRGFLQNWLRRHMDRGMTIFSTSLLFTLAHFSTKQGIKGNITILTSLFILALFLSFIYERQKTLIAPIALHMSFNALNIISMLVK